MWLKCYSPPPAPLSFWIPPLVFRWGWVGVGPKLRILVLPDPGVIPAQYYVVDDANTMLIGQFQAEDVWSVKAGDRVCNSRGCWAVGELVIEMVVNE